MPKKVNEISKFFKKNNIVKETIKNKFTELQNKKIENIQKIIKDKDKSKPRLNMTTKGLSHKQIIILMNSDNNIQFMKEASSHVVNINRVLKNIKSTIMADFIHSEKTGITITTNNVASSLDLQIIEQYVKNVSNIEASHILPQDHQYSILFGEY